MEGECDMVYSNEGSTVVYYADKRLNQIKAGDKFYNARDPKKTPIIEFICVSFDSCQRRGDFISFKYLDDNVCYYLTTDEFFETYRKVEEEKMAKKWWQCYECKRAFTTEGNEPDFCPYCAHDTRHPEPRLGNTNTNIKTTQIRLFPPNNPPIP
jgi:hypothetical protein